MKNFVPILLMAAGFSACLYTDIRSPRAYRSATPSEVKAEAADEVVTGRSCNRSYLYLVAVGKGGYHEAIKNALGGRTDVLLYDVKTDISVQSYVLGLYTKVCTNVRGKVGRP